MITADITSRIPPSARRALRVAAFVLLVIWPLINIRQGVDISDQTYSLTNYRYLDSLDPMWLFATWIPNMLGSFLLKLTGGSLAAMNLACSLIVSATAVVTWLGLRPFVPEPLLFLGIWIAESTWWCPSVILYNTLTYFFMTLGSILLVRAFYKNDQKYRYYVLAGICLGVNVFVRFPNVAEAGLIISVIYFEFLTARKVIPVLRSVGVCLLGYITGVIIPLVIISLRYGFLSYVGMIGSLFSMTGGASDYTPGGMLNAIIATYLTTLVELLLVVPVLIVGLIMFTLLENMPRMRIWATAAYIILFALLLRWYYATGVVTISYWYYDCMFEVAMMVIIGAIVLSVLMLLPKVGCDAPQRAFCLTSLMSIFIIPLGSNNHTYPLINDLFLILPAAFLSLKVMYENVRTAKNGERMLWQRSIHYAWQIPAVLLVCLLLVQASIFHMVFCFGDGTDGTKRDAVVTGVPAIRGMHTTKHNAELLEEMYADLNTKFRENVVAAGSEAIVLGNAPGFHYLFGMAPALRTAWPDLDSYEIRRMEEEINDIAGSGRRPLVIMYESSEHVYDGSSDEPKRDILLDYMDKNGYNILFEVSCDGQGKYEVYSADE